MPITNLYFTDFGPFDKISFEFDRQVNVFTGPNNTGKTAALLMLGELLVYPFSAPAKFFRSHNPSWKIGYSIGNETKFIEGNMPSEVDPMLELYKAVGYTCFLPAQRSGTDFRASGPSPQKNLESHIDSLVDLVARARPNDLRKQGYEALRQIVRNTIHFEHPELIKRRNLILSDASIVGDQEIIQRIVNLDYAAYRKKRPEIGDIIRKIISLASELTEGFPMNFLGIGEDERGLFPQVTTPSGVLPVHVLSQGTQSIIHCLAHLIIGYAEYYGFPTDLEKKPGILVIDEIDAHLHPSWQRRIIPTLLRYFPKLQIFCSTHSPLMLAGLKAGQVQLLRREEDGTLAVSRNEPDIAGWTADEILRNFLEVSTPTDMATAEHVTRLGELRHKDELTDDEERELQCLRRTVGSEILRGPTSALVENFAEELRRAQSEPSDSSAATSSRPGAKRKTRRSRN